MLKRVARDMVASWIIIHLLVTLLELISCTSEYLRLDRSEIICYSVLFFLSGCFGGVTKLALEAYVNNNYYD